MEAIEIDDLPQPITFLLCLVQQDHFATCPRWKCGPVVIQPQVCQIIAQTFLGKPNVENGRGHWSAQ